MLAFIKLPGKSSKLCEIYLTTYFNHLHSIMYVLFFETEINENSFDTRLKLTQLNFEKSVPGIWSEHLN